MSKFLNQERVAKANPLLEARLRSLENQKAFSLERTAVIRGVVVYNDSAAVNGEMSMESMAILDKPLCWVVDAKLVIDNTPGLEMAIAQYAKCLIAVGPTAESFFERFRLNLNLFITASTWEEGLESALLASKANGLVLVSPGTRPIDPFENYKERGAYFNRLIKLKMGETL